MNEEWLGFMITARLSTTELYLIPNLIVVQRPKQFLQNPTVI